mmetsp:Transcript_44364/g.100300  ORF Transcript_44364/g.100300 Transcript_44364/m.100300 type:complete len:232 (+) Transcript_44364:36-731(+)|eukprot:CAMPEP_0172591556 /NCGR_PEP_ID=MMETSP1068-20121228/10385_1 /TAXON_ID=35684 /ORGANISM="Pseudopedinella elastica, Strain CCMP716" /LENGTH=231 /DNA_ID=CAMNT_0013388107 /DNA_START=31 /DNA_END=726 /DNA_ORIENTATION=-
MGKRNAIEKVEEILCNVSPASVQIWAGTFVAVLLISIGLYVYLKREMLMNSFIDHAFDSVDDDKSGSIDANEYEKCIIIMYGEINKYVRVKRPPKEDIMAYLKNIDADKNAKISKEEFRELFVEVGGNISIRVCTMLAVTALSPVFGKLLVSNIEAFATSINLEDKIYNSLGGGCTKDAVQAGLPFLNEQLLTTITSLMLVYTVVPWLFEYFDRNTKKNLLREKIALEKQS